jgi:CheY-like chemotaxis protein
VRCQAGEEGLWRIALAFERVAPHVEDWLRSRVTRVLERQSATEPYRGLVVGPDNVDRGALVDDLERMGFGVIAVDTVPEAVQYLGQQPAPFEFIAVDAVSECAEGVDLLAMARRIYPKMPCILVGSAAESEYLERECKFLERSTLLLRPWTSQDLRRAVTTPSPEP